MEKMFINIGSDLTALIPLTDLNGLPLDLSAFTRIDLFLQLENGQEAIKSYSTDDNTLTIEDSPNGLISFNLKRADTLLFEPNTDYYFTVKCWETDAQFEDNVAKYESELTYFATTKKRAGYGS